MGTRGDNIRYSARYVGYVKDEAETAKHLIPKQRAEGSNPFSRSNQFAKFSMSEVPQER